MDSSNTEVASDHPPFFKIYKNGRVERISGTEIVPPSLDPTSGSDDPYINPASDPKLGSLGCGSVLVCVAGKDLLKDRGFYYRELLEKSGWGGAVEVMEAPGEDHVFHLNNPVCENSAAMLKRIASFINQ